MFNFFYINFKKGIKKINDNPQLIYTIVVAFLIIVAFIFISERFIKIANDAQERLVNVRIGSLQDAFVSFAGDKIDDPIYLNDKIKAIVNTNETIKNFRVVVKETYLDETSNTNLISYKIIASNIQDEIGKTDDQSTFSYTFASSDPNNSITTALEDKNERLFKTTRAMTNNNGIIIGFVTTTQTLSLADMVIKKDIKNSKIILLAVILLVMFLFFRHSKIIDYVDLYKKLKEVDTLKDDFISMASHELRTPLSIIRGYAEFMRGAPELSTETKDYVSKIDISARELDSLVSDILDVSKIEQERMSFEYIKINPSETINQVVTSLELSAKEKGIVISFNKGEVEETQIINIDLNRFKQILINLIGNAVKYTSKGEVIIRQYKENNFLCIRVSDTGIGMSEEERVKLFEKFYRIRNKETENIRGTGLGLWITSKIIKQMGGNLSVESIKGVGSHFIVSFPIVKNN